MPPAAAAVHVTVTAATVTATVTPTATMKLQASSSDSTAGSQLELVGNQHKDPEAPPYSPSTATPVTPVNSVDTFNDFSNRYSAVQSPNGPLQLHRERWYSKRVRRRLVYKNGECNISHANIKKRRQRYLADIFTTLVDIKWRWNLLIFILAFTMSWMLFALIWWLICFSHGDFENRDNPDWKPCVAEVQDFTTALLFSIETQHTIGYGSRHTTPNCPEAILVMMMQSCFGVIIQALMTGLVFAKLSRPKKRAETLMFSKNAVICKRDGELCLLFRVGDMRRSHIVEAHVRAILIKKRVTLEGEVMPLFQHELQMGEIEGECKLFLVWPVILEHRIDENSPFWEISADDLHREQFELVIILEGIVESTGMTAQARTSYLPGEILWGHRFERLVTFQKENGEYQIDYSRFHSTVAMDTPQVCAKDLADMQKSVDGDGDGDGDDGDDDDDDDDDDSSSVSSSLAAQETGRQLTPLIMKRSSTTQTPTTPPPATVAPLPAPLEEGSNNDLDNESRNSEDEDRDASYHYNMGNHI